MERLATAVAALTGETKAEAIRRSLEERLQRLRPQYESERRRRVLTLPDTRIWPGIPASQLGRRLTTAEEDDILGYGPDKE